MKTRFLAKSPLAEIAAGNEPLLTVTVECDADGACVITTGEVDASTADEFRAAMHQALDAQPSVAVDMAGVVFLDSSGLTALIGAYKRAESLGGGLRVTNPSSQVLRVLELVGQRERFVGTDFAISA